MQINLFVAFARAGLLGYGGGLSAVPLMKKEVVDRYKWMDDNEFGDILALANTLPGPINTKMSGYIGWRLSGWSGLLASLFGNIFPTAFLMVLLLTLLNTFKEYSWVQGMAKGVIPIAGVMIGVMAIDFLKKSWKGLGKIPTILLALGSLVVIGFMDIHPAIIIILLILSAFAPLEKFKRKERGVKK